MDAFMNIAKLNFPAHLDQSLFEKVIRKHTKDQNAKVVDFSLEPGSNYGDNFSSHVYRAKIKFTSKFQKGESEISVIIKTLGESLNEAISGFEIEKYLAVFEIEIEMYEKVLSEFENVLGEVFWPKLIYSMMDGKLPVIILEDVKPKGFDYLLQTPPEDFEASKMIIRKLAKFHAASFYLQNEQRCDFTHFNKTYHRDDALSEVIVGNSLKGLNASASVSDKFEVFLPAMKDFEKNYKKKTMKSYEVQKGPFAFNVLNHADFHLKNVLFKRGEGDKIEDVCIYDYQVCYYGSPAIDISYALYFFLSDENREAHRDELIAAYHAQFVELLKSLGYLKAIPSLLELQIELLRNGNLQAMMALCYTIGMHFDFKTITPEEMADPVAMQRRIYTTDSYQKMILKELPRFMFCGMI